MERDGRAHSELVSGSLDSTTQLIKLSLINLKLSVINLKLSLINLRVKRCSVRWLEFPHIPEFLSKNVHVGGEGRENGRVCLLCIS